MKCTVAMEKALKGSFCENELSFHPRHDIGISNSLGVVVRSISRPEQRPMRGLVVHLAGVTTTARFLQVQFRRPKSTLSLTSQRSVSVEKLLSQNLKKKGKSV